MIEDQGNAYFKYVRAFDLADLLHKIEWDHGAVLVGPNKVKNLCVFRVGKTPEDIGKQLGYIDLAEDEPTFHLFDEEKKA